MMNFLSLQNAALKRGITEIEIYSSKSTGIEISGFNAEIESNITSNTDVLAIRGVYNNQIVTVYEENDSDEMIDSILDRIIDNASIKNNNDPYFIYKGDKSYPNIVEKDHDYSHYDLDFKTNLCKRLNEICRSKSPYVVNVETSYSEEQSIIEIVNSNGLNVKRNSLEAYITCYVMAQKENETKVGHDYQIFNNIKDINLNSIAEKAVKQAVGGFGAQSIPSGKYRVVIDKKVVSNLLSAFSSVFSAESILKNLSFLKDKIGGKVFGENISLIDDPLSDKALTQYAFDDEGVSAKTKYLVENGVLKTYLHNLKTASMMNTSSTGNGFKSSVSSSVGIQPCNLYLKPGNISFEEMLKKVNDGVYITNVTGLHAGLNPISGEFNLQSSGYMIENGEITRPVTLIILSGKLDEMLNKVTYIANDFEFKSNVGTSSIAVESLAISGK